MLVAYRSYDLLKAMFERLPTDVPVAVVDNASGVDGTAELARARPNTRYLDGGGVGFARAANLGARTSRADVVVFVNPDTAPTRDDLTALVAHLDSSPDLAGVSALTVLPDGRIELGVGGWEPSVARSLAHAVGLHRLFPTWGLMARPTPYRPINLDWVTGACLAVPRETFLQLGGFDEEFFVYSEDVAYGRRVREAGLRQELRTDILVPHASSGSGGSRSAMFQMRSASLMRYVRRHHGALPVMAIRLALTAGTLVRAVAAARSKPNLAREHLYYVWGLWRGAPEIR